MGRRKTKAKDAGPVAATPYMRWAAEQLAKHGDVDGLSMTEAEAVRQLYGKPLSASDESGSFKLQVQEFQGQSQENRT